MYQDHRVLVVTPEVLVKTVVQDLQDPRVPQELQVRQVSPGLRASLVLLELTDRTDPQVCREALDLMVSLDPWGPQDLTVSQESQETPEQQEHQDWWERWDLLETLDNLDLTVNQDHKAPLVPRVMRVSQVTQVFKDHQELQDLRDQRVLPGNQDLTDQLVLLDQQDRTVCLV